VLDMPFGRYDIKRMIRPILRRVTLVASLVALVIFVGHACVHADCHSDKAQCSLCGVSIDIGHAPLKVIEPSAQFIATPLEQPLSVPLIFVDAPDSRAPPAS